MHVFLTKVDVFTKFVNANVPKPLRNIRNLCIWFDADTLQQCEVVASLSLSEKVLVYLWRLWHCYWQGHKILVTSMVPHLRFKTCTISASRDAGLSSIMHEHRIHVQYSLMRIGDWAVAPITTMERRTNSNIAFLQEIYWQLDVCTANLYLRTEVKWGAVSGPRAAALVLRSPKIGRECGYARLGLHGDCTCTCISKNWMSILLLTQTAFVRGYFKKLFKSSWWLYLDSKTVADIRVGMVRSSC